MTSSLRQIRTHSTKHLKNNHLPREPLLEWSVGHVGVEGADFSPHLPHQPSFQRTQRHMGVEGDFGLPIYVFRCVTSGSSEARPAGRESGGEVERSGCERVAPTMRAIGDCGDALLRCIFVYSWMLFKIVLGFTARRRPWKAGSSQNGDFLPRFGIYPFLAAFQGTSIPKRF